jgi:hypothetical protein
MDRYSNSSEFKGKLEIGNNSAAEFDTKFINIAELFTKSDSTQKLFSIEFGCRIITNFEFPFKS